MIHDWDWEAAEASFRRAIAADPSYPTGHQWYADFLWARGRLDEALEEMKEAHRLDPMSLVIGTELGQTYYLRKHYQQAELQPRETLALDANYGHALHILGLVHLQQHRYPEAVRPLERALTLAGFSEDLAGGLADAYPVSGNRAAATRFTADLEQRLRDGSVGPFALALAYTGQGDFSRGFECLNRAIDGHDIFLPEDLSTRSSTRCAPIPGSRRWRPAWG